MKKLIYLFCVLFVVGCGEVVTIDSEVNQNLAKFKTDLYSLQNKKNIDLFGGYGAYDLSNSFKDLDKYKGKTYKDVLKVLVDKKEKKKELEKIAKENKKKDKELSKKELPKLEKNFTKNKDEFSGTIWYRHKAYGKYTPNRKTLVVRVLNSGYIYMTSNYYSSDWVFHTNVQVKVGDKTYQSADIPTYKDDNKTDNSGGDVWETVSYVDGTDNGIIKAIALNPDAKVLVRFNGSKHYDETTLSAKDKQAIKDCYELSQLLKKIN